MCHVIWKVVKIADKQMGLCVPTLRQEDEFTIQRHELSNARGKWLVFFSCWRIICVWILPFTTLPTWRQRRPLTKAGTTTTCKASTNVFINDIVSVTNVGGRKSCWLLLLRKKSTVTERPTHIEPQKQWYEIYFKCKWCVGKSWCQHLS